MSFLSRPRWCPVPSKCSHIPAPAPLSRRRHKMEAAGRSLGALRKAGAGCCGEQQHRQQHAGSNQGKPRGARRPPGRVTISRPQGRAGQGRVRPAAAPGRRGGTFPPARPPWPWERRPCQSRSAGSGCRSDLRLLFRYRARPGRQRPARDPAAPVRQRPSPSAGVGPGVRRGVRSPLRRGLLCPRAPPALGPRSFRWARHKVGAGRAAGKR